MKVGDYVRTKYGEICKLEKSKYSYLLYETDIEIDRHNDRDCNDCGFDSDTIKDIVKSSPNIIDLIEVGDLLKIEYYSLRYEERVTRLFEVYYKDNKFMNLGNIKCEFMLVDGDFNDNDKKLEPIIKSIVTKEQFESMEYKLGDKENECKRNV